MAGVMFFKSVIYRCMCNVDIIYLYSMEMFFSDWCNIRNDTCNIKA